ncbi:peptidoglycan/LPS O-acetylase OafA/YrhL [Lacinutrix venerupis]|uniref:acyltransferase family protein n=1 Tax=Lacinutrix venerupis TaxID=1486034 RepID=UPI000F16FE27|nr:acyltransferase [Lacinutrix venerupis]RLJ69007.1 peptidoglycan/LPS O-acetylase OafA/YrhL [Lacinutrix venerupis]
MKINSILSKTDSLVIKGIGILLIISHNFLHWLKPMIGENEFSYNSIYVENFFSSIKSNPINVLQYIIAFLGHYGIYLFIFISGYGLTILYLNTTINYKEFIKKRLAKLYPVFTIALIALFIYNYLIFKQEFNSNDAINFLLRFTLLANLIPKKVFVLNGPFWFYSLIVQLYLLFPFLISLLKKNPRILYIISVIAFIVVFLFNEQLSHINFSLYYNFVGHLPVFIFGIIYAVKGNVISTYLKWMALTALIIIVLSFYNRYFWYLSGLSVLILFLYLFTYFKKYNFSKKVLNFIIYTGGLSYYLFAVHGFIRKPWVGWANNINSNLINYVYLIVFILCSYCAAIVVKKIEQFYFSLKNN